MTTQPGPRPRAIEAPIQQENSARMLDVRRTDLHSRFFHVFQYRFASELLDDLGRLPLDHLSFAQSLDARRSYYGGWHYWLLYLKGYTQYQANGTVDADNVYLQHLTLGLTAPGVDPTLRPTPASAITEMILRRFADCDRLSRPASARQFAANELTPVKVFVRTPPATEDTLTLYSVDSPEPLRARLVDGHHRLFAARLFGVERVRYRILAEPETVPEVPGEVTYVDLGGQRGRVEGWLAPPTAAVQMVELRSEGRTVGRAGLTPLAPAPLGDEPGVHAFSVDIDTSTLGSAWSLQVMVLSDWLPVGTVHAGLSPG
jgi:hypothetical protein